MKLKPSKKFLLRNEFLEIDTKLHEQESDFHLGDGDLKKTLEIASSFSELVVKYDTALYGTKKSESDETLDYNQVFQFMQVFPVDYINKYGEMIIDEKTNMYSNFKDSKDFDDVLTHVVFSLCRPIAKGLEVKDAKRMLHRINKYFKVNLTREDMHVMYGELCYRDKFDEFKDFIKRGFPMDELRKDGVES